MRVERKDMDFMSFLFFWAPRHGGYFPHYFFDISFPINVTTCSIVEDKEY